MSAGSNFREALVDAVLERHCANHPMTEKWARGELSRNCLKGVAVQHWHWISQFPEWGFSICAKAPLDVVAMQLENFNEETDEDRPHLDIILRFAKVNGADIDEVKKGRGLPTTRAYVDWLIKVSQQQPWWCGIAASTIGTESQSPMLYSKVLPALREKYKYKEEDIEHFWLHSEADIEHGDRGFSVLEKHCTTREMQEAAIHYARESARMRWFYFDGIYLHYEQGYDFV
jgi:pyrroloquinoline-quinone synthase